MTYANPLPGEANPFARMIVVSDASPITTLLKADQATLLKKLFDFVIIPEAVSEELLAFHTQLPGFVRIQPVSARNHRLPGTENLGNDMPLRISNRVLLQNKEFRCNRLLTAWKSVGTPASS